MLFRSLASQFVTFVPIANNRDRQISLYKSGALSTSASRARPTRIDVDWPAMVSDADYFPAARPPAGGDSASGGGGAGQTAPRPHLGRASELAPVGRPALPVRLQFAHDYQAREGVPIYNNNVRLLGSPSGLRQRSSLAAEQLAPGRAQKGEFAREEAAAAAAEEEEQEREAEENGAGAAASSPVGQLVAPITRKEHKRVGGAT